MCVGGNFVAHKLAGCALDRLNSQEHSWDSMPPSFVIDVNRSP